MPFELKKDCKYAMLVPTSMGVRITPPNGQPVHSSTTFEMYATSAETNVASISSYLGLPVKVLTTFVKDSPIAHFIKSNLRSRNMDFEGPEIPQGGPWGYRHQFNIADSGFLFLPTGTFSGAIVRPDDTGRTARARGNSFLRNSNCLYPDCPALTNRDNAVCFAG